MANFPKGDLTLSQAMRHIEFNSDENDAVKGWITVFAISRTVLDHYFTTHNFLNCFIKVFFFFSEGRFINNNL